MTHNPPPPPTPNQCVIGLPARGKTYIARKVARYLRWINYRTRVFCLARYRQDKYGHKQAAEFFDTSNLVRESWVV